MGLTGVFTTSRRGVGSRRSKRLSVLLSVTLTMAMVVPSLSIAVDPSPLPDLTIWYVDSTVDDDSGSGTMEDPFKTITYAVNVAASAGDTIMVNGGDGSGYEYTHVDKSGYEFYPIGISCDLTIKSYGESKPILDAENNSQIFIISGMGDTNVSISSSYEEDSAPPPAVEPDVTLDGLTLLRGYGGFTLPGLPGFPDGPIHSEAAPAGGSVYIGGLPGGAVAAQNTILTVRDCDFENSQAGFFGGALGAYESTVTVEGSSFNNNEAGYAGGAMYFEDSKVEITNSTIGENSADADGIKTPVQEAGISDSLLEPGVALADGLETRGGGIAAVGSMTEMTERPSKSLRSSAPTAWCTSHWTTWWMRCAAATRRSSRPATPASRGTIPPVTWTRRNWL